MRKSDPESILSGSVLDDDIALTFGELCRVCQLPAERVVELVEFGIVEPLVVEPLKVDPSEGAAQTRGARRVSWRFEAVSITRVSRAQRLQRDLGVNVAGVALALDLLDEMELLRRQIQRLEARQQ